MQFEPSAQLASLTCFSGIILSDAWVEVAKRVDFNTKLPTALVVGSALEFDGEMRGLPNREILKEISSSIAHHLANNGFHLVNGACPGLPDEVMSEFIVRERKGVAIGLSAYPSPVEHRLSKPFAENGFPVRGDLTVYIGCGFEMLNVINTFCADLLVVTGGGVGTMLEVATAVEQEIPVICLSSSGGIAAEIESILQKYIASRKTFNVTTVESVQELGKYLENFRSHSVPNETRAARLLNEIDTQMTAFSRSLTTKISDDCNAITYTVDNTEPCLSA